VLQRVRALPRFVGIQPGVRLSGLLLMLQILGAVIPVINFLCQTVFYRRLGFGDEFQFPRPDLFEMLRHHIGDRVGLRLLLEIATDPGAFGAADDRHDIGLVGAKRPIIQIRRIMKVSDGSGRIHLDIEHALGDDTPVPCPRHARVLDGVLEVEQHPRLVARIALVDEHRPSPQQIAVPLNDEVERRIQ
jgi:hypothetical protein